MRKTTWLLTGGALLSFAQPCLADVLAYPAKGQSADQQKKDQYECFEWAKSQTGIDPHNMAGEAPAQPPSQGGQAARGAARGAAAGAIGGAIAGDAGKGAAIGAGVGGATGAVRRRQGEAAAQQQQQQAQAQQQQALTAFNDAQGVCLKGRGYSIK
jgi:hypothetical protein